MMKLVKIGRLICAGEAGDVGTLHSLARGKIDLTFLPVGAAWKGGCRQLDAVSDARRAADRGSSHSHQTALWQPR